MAWQALAAATTRSVHTVWRRRVWLARLAGLACGLAITALSLLPPEAATAASGHDKLKHAAAYACLAGAWSLALDRPALVAVVLVASGFGLGLELAQGLMPFGREASWADALANTVGAALGAGVGRVLYPVWRTGSDSGSISSRSGARP